MAAKHRYDAEATQAELAAAARALFSREGFASTRMVEVAREIGLTRGALYHHFASKKGLFRAVLVGLQTDLTAEIIQCARAAPGGSMDRLRAGFHAYLDLALRDDVRQILFIDGPAVLGWDDWREIDLQHGFRITQYAIEQAIDAGEIDRVPVDELTHVLLGALTHACLEVGRAADPSGARAAYGETIDFMLDRLRAG